MCLQHHYVVTEKVSQIIASIKTKIHITELASGLMLSINQFKPDRPFFIRIVFFCMIRFRVSVTPQLAHVTAICLCEGER